MYLLVSVLSRYSVQVVVLQENRVALEHLVRQAQGVVVAPLARRVQGVVVALRGLLGLEVVEVPQVHPEQMAEVELQGHLVVVVVGVELEECQEVVAVAVL